MRKEIKIGIEVETIVNGNSGGYKMKEFNELLEQLTNEEFWNWVSSWYDEQNIMDNINNWEDELKKDTCEELKEIIAKRKK